MQMQRETARKHNSFQTRGSWRAWRRSDVAGVACVLKKVDRDAWANKDSDERAQFTRQNGRQ
jgi:hypothetical protein